MIPKLFDKSATVFTSNGLGRLSSCIRCIVTEERNGIFECEFDYPVTGVHFEDIQMGRIILCTHDEQGDVQPFDIYAKTEPINGIVTFYARHISYRLNEITVKPFTAGSCAEAMTKIGTQSVTANPFTFWTDKSVTASYMSEIPRKARPMLGGEENSILDVFGTGEYEFDKFDVKLHLHRGQDTNVSIRYGKNLVDFNNNEDTSDTYTAVVPFWLGSEMVDDESVTVLVTLPEWFITSGHTVPSGREVIVPMDLSGDFSEKPSVSDLRTRAQSRLASSDGWLPNQTVTINFVQLWQTEEYKDYAPLQRLRLCDTCGVFVPMYGMSLRAKVIKVVYNVLLDRYDSMELGDKPTTYAAVIEKSFDSKVAGLEQGLEAVRVDVQTAVDTANAYTDGEITDAKADIKTAYEQAIEDATEQIRGGTGGYIVTTVNADGQPIELLITDDLDLNQAVNIWRWNLGGLAHSSNGYDGPFTDVAITQDGKINASMIMTGILNANLIKAGILSDDSGLNYWNLVSGFLQTKQGQLGPFAVNQDSLVFTPAGGDSSISMYSYQAGGYTIPAIRAYVDNGYSYPSQAMDIASSHLYFYKGNMRTIDESVYFSIGTVIYSYGSGYSAPYVQSLYIGAEYSPLLEFMPPRQNTEEYAIFNTPIRANAGFKVTAGTKQKVVKTLNYSDRSLYCYETPTPLFGDIGEAVLDEEGICYVDIDDIFSETIAEQVEYQVFLQKEGEGDCWIAEKHRRYFVIQGTPNLSVAWELKAKQRDFEAYRLEIDNSEVGQYARIKEDKTFENYITEQEELLYG